MAVSFVAGSTVVFSTADTINATTPAGIADGDKLLAGVFGRGTLDTPSGWTKLDETAQFSSENGDFLQRLAVFSKNTVTSADSSTSFTFTVGTSEGSSPRMGVAYQVWRDVDSVAETLDNTTAPDSYAITPSTSTAAADGTGLAVWASVVYIGDGFGPYTPTSPSSFTLSSGSSITSGRLAAAYRIVSTGQSNSGAFDLAPGASAPSDLYGELNGAGAIIVRLAPAAAAAALAYLQVDSPLGGPALRVTTKNIAWLSVASPLDLVSAPAVAVDNDYNDLLDGQPTYAVMDLVMDDDSLVRVPISSFQATLQLDNQCYLRCAIPSPAAYLDDVNAAVSFRVTLLTTSRRTGEVVSKVIATAPVETVQSDQGGTNYTAQISGYFAAYPALATQLAGFYRPQRHVQIVSTQPDTQRLRTAFDWVLIPGQVATFADGNGSITVAYQNIYMTDGAFYQDIGSRTTP